MYDLGFPNKNEWLVEIKDNGDDFSSRMIQVWEDEIFPIKEVQ